MKRCHVSWQIFAFFTFKKKLFWYIHFFFSFLFLLHFLSYYKKGINRGVFLFQKKTKLRKMPKYIRNNYKI